MKNTISIRSIFSWRMEQSRMFAEGRYENKMLDEFLKKAIEKIKNYQGENWIDINPDNLKGRS